MGSNATNCLDDVVEAPYTGRVGENIGKTNQLINYLLLSAPVVHKTPQMRNDKIDIGKLGRKQLNQVGAANNIDQHGDAKLLNRFTDLTRWRGIETVQQDQFHGF